MAAGTPTQAGLSIFIPTAELIRQSRAAQRSLEAHTHDLLELLGKSMLELILEAYEEKASGRTGSDGVTWDPIQIGTWLARQRRSGRIKRQPKQPKTSATSGHFRIAHSYHASDEDVYDQMIEAGAAKVISKGKGKGGGKYTRGTVIGIVRDKKGSTKENLRKTISPSSGGYQIGIDKGMQRQSLMPGKGGGDDGPNVIFQTTSVTVGAAMHYSKHFDQHREIIPAVLPDAWIDDLEEKTEAFGLHLVQEAFEETPTAKAT